METAVSAEGTVDKSMAHRRDRSNPKAGRGKVASNREAPGILRTIQNVQVKPGAKAATHRAVGRPAARAADRAAARANRLKMERCRGKGGDPGFPRHPRPLLAPEPEMRPSGSGSFPKRPQLVVVMMMSPAAVTAAARCARHRCERHFSRRRLGRIRERGRRDGSATRNESGAQHARRFVDGAG